MCAIGFPGIYELIPIFLAMSLYVLPLAFVVFVVVFLIKINNTLTNIQNKLDEPEQKELNKRQRKLFNTEIIE